MLLNAPAAAQCVLAIGCGDGQLEHAYRRRQAGARWWDANHLSDLATADSTLVLRLKNSATLSAIERLIEADLTDSSDHVGEKPRSHSPSSVCKLLMDAGWMPSLAGWRDAKPIAEGVTAAALAMADVLDFMAQVHGNRRKGVREALCTEGALAESTV